MFKGVIGKRHAGLMMANVATHDHDIGRSHD
jgi:hypothetical protein